MTPAPGKVLRVKVQDTSPLRLILETEQQMGTPAGKPVLEALSEDGERVRAEERPISASGCAHCWTILAMYELPADWAGKRIERVVLSVDGVESSFPLR